MFVSRILALLAAGAAIAPAAVFAVPAPTVVVNDDTVLTRQMHVETADLDLTNAAGRRALRSRIDHAVSEVCSLPDLPDNFDDTRCRQIAMTGAKTQTADAIARSARHYAEAKAQPAAPNTASGS